MVELTKTALMVLLAVFGLAGLTPILGVLVRERTLRNLEKARKDEVDGYNQIIDGH